jgi:ribonuclease E
MTDSSDERPLGRSADVQANSESSGESRTASAPTAPESAAEGAEAGKPAKRSRGRRGGRGRRRKDKPGSESAADTGADCAGAEASAPLPSPALPSASSADSDAAGPEASSPGDAPGDAGGEGEAKPAKRSRGRGRRGGKGRAKGEGENAPPAPQAAQPADDADLPYCEDLSEEGVAGQKAECKKKRKKMFIGVLPGELVEVVLTEDGAVQEYYVEMLHQAKTKGNIYKGYIHNIDSALQAAFINYGAERNGFLQIDEVHPEYYQGTYPLKKGQRFPLMQKVLKAGQEVLVQVVKEPTGKKGAFVTSYLSLPGRYFVYTLGRDQQGVSRKIEDEKERERLKGVIDQIAPPEGVGLIVRTAGIGRAKTELLRDYKYLHRLWGDIKKRVQTEKAPALVYKEMELSVRAARDYLTSDVGEIWVDDPDTAEQIREYVALAFPKSPNMVKIHTETDRTLWERFGLTRQVEQIYSREVTLPSGGRLVFDHTEALTSVDINSGKIGGEQSFAKMALKTNSEAAQEIARQLRLRDIGGQIVIDFIEMKDGKHLREVEKVMRQALKSDRARTDVSGISPFGLMELVRQRLGSSAISVSSEPCPCCGGTGIRRNLEWQALQAMKTIHRLLMRPGCPSPLQFPVGQELAIYMLNNKRELLTEMGARMDVRVEIKVDPKLP